MCGIGGIIQLDRRKVFDEETQLNAISLLGEMEKRGTHAWGVYIEKKSGNYHTDCGVKDKTIPGELFKMPDSIGEFLNDNGGLLYLDKTHTILMHTRQETGGDPNINVNNHPFNTKNFILAHNGIISNDRELVKKYNIETDIECDSYIIVALIQKWYDEGFSVKNSIIKMSEELDGGYACWLYDKDKRKLYLFRNNRNPIQYYKDEDKGLLIFASEDDYIVDTYDDKEKLTNVEVESLDINEIFELGRDGLKSIGKLKSPATTTWSAYNCNNRNYNTNTNISTIDSSLKKLYKLFMPYDNIPEQIQTIISVIQNEVVILVSNNALVKLLNKTVFKDTKQDGMYKSEYTKYRISPKEEINKMVDTLIDGVGDIPMLDGKHDVTFNENLKELGETLDLTYSHINGYYCFEGEYYAKIPVEARKVFKDVGLTFGRKKIKIKDTDGNRMKLGRILKGMGLMDGTNN